MQSRTCVDTVQIVLEGLPNSRDILLKSHNEGMPFQVLLSEEYQNDKPRPYLCTDREKESECSQKERNTVEKTCIFSCRTGVNFHMNIHRFTESDTAEFTVETNHTSVHCVTNVFANSATCSYVDVMYTATEDHITVLTVGSCLRQTLN